MKSLSGLAFVFSFKARNRGANSEPFKEDYNETLYENTSKIMLCDSTSVPMYASTVSYAPHATLIRTFSNGLPAKR